MTENNEIWKPKLDGKPRQEGRYSIRAHDHVKHDIWTTEYRSDDAEEIGRLCQQLNIEHDTISYMVVDSQLQEKLKHQ